jgi:hypothetical protein
MLLEAGFSSVEITIAPRSAEIVNSWMAGADRFIASATIEARRGAAKADTTAGDTAAKSCCGPTCCT